ncbi:biopolymer transport protein ExbD [Haloferula luteola]|uniref:Biopolymer transport protein ExbD n=1 Tax=Haloferula luteola TaxID=595692 RepID=A0A840V520_9BACT|nr:biopolymer transporter ExbD [Haloferula luteola]MBB5349888.1 biopolymer transport protein ExbD [Haloferula luteola]
MRIDLEEDNEIGVDMAPLIDCVFLLLIFFLVTTMMKKWETQIPLTLPESTSSLSTSKTNESSEVIALGIDKTLYTVAGRNTYTGETTYKPIDDLERHLSDLKAARGSDIPLEIAADRSIPVKRVIEIFDICQLSGFKQTRVRLGSRPNMEPEVEAP